MSPLWEPVRGVTQTQMVCGSNCYKLNIGGKFGTGLGDHAMTNVSDCCVLILFTPSSVSYTLTPSPSRAETAGKDDGGSAFVLPLHHPMAEPVPVIYKLLFVLFYSRASSEMSYPPTAPFIVGSSNNTTARR